MDNTVKVKIYTSFGKNWIIAFLDKRTAYNFISYIENPDFQWSIIHPIVGVKNMVKIRHSSIMALEVIEKEGGAE